MHTSVLLHESIDGLDIKPNAVVVDGTVGAGGHSTGVCKRQSSVKLFCFDMDTDALARSKERIQSAGCKAEMIEGNFAGMKEELAKRGVDLVDGIILDLGLSSYQFGASGRGFSFFHNEPLVMTLKKNPNAGDVTAYDVVNSWSEESLADIIYGFGEERYARRIAKAIVERRKEKNFENTGELAECISLSVPVAYRHGKIHPATKTFQAIRIAVNSELEVLRKGLYAGVELLHSGGRMAVISFHSLEDRIVKNTFMKYEKEGFVKRITKKPIVPSAEEVKDNPRSRSAKLRIIEKI